MTIVGRLRSRPIVTQADAARDRRDWTSAADLYRQVLEMAPARAGAWVQLGHVLKESGAYQEAAQAYSRALDLRPRSADIHLQIGHLNKLRGDLGAAAACYASARALGRGDNEAASELQRLGHSIAVDGSSARAQRSGADDASATLGDLITKLNLAERRLGHLLSSPHLRPTCYTGDNRVLTVTIRGDRMYVDARDIAISTSIICWGGWEENTAGILERFLKPGMVWADVGANCGYFTVIGHKLVRRGSQTGETHAFEISPNNFRLCVDNLALTWMSEGSRVKNIAIYSEDREAISFEIFEKYSVNSGLMGVTPDHAAYVGESPKSVSVQAMTLDAYFANRSKPQFIKVDIEGGEWHALSGARQLIVGQPDLRLLVEWSPQQLVNCGTAPQALAKLITELGLECFNAEDDMKPMTPSECIEIPDTTMLLLSRSRPND